MELWPHSKLTIPLPNHHPRHMIMGSKVVAWFLSYWSIQPCLQKSESITPTRLDVWCTHRPGVSYQMAAEQLVWICCMFVAYGPNKPNCSPPNSRFHLQASLPRKGRGHRLFAPLLGRQNTGLGDVHDQDEVPKNLGTWAKEHVTCFLVTKLQNQDQ